MDNLHRFPQLSHRGELPSLPTTSVTTTKSISNSLQPVTADSISFPLSPRSQNIEMTNGPDRIGVCVTSNFASLPIQEPTFCPTPYVSQMLQQYLTALQCEKNASLPDENFDSRSYHPHCGQIVNMWE